MKILLLALFISSIDAFTINCAFVNMVWPNLGMTYTCMVHRSLSVSSPNQQFVTGVRGAHLAGRSNSDVRMVNFDDVDDLVVVPRGMSNFFPTLHGIRIFDTDVRNLNGNELNEYTHLRWFMLFDSDVSRIPDNFFAKNPNLFYVSFDENYIREASSRLFDSNNNVRGMSYVGFRRNICINQQATNANQIDNLLRHLDSNCRGGGTTSSPGTTSRSTVRPSSSTTSRWSSSTSGSSSSAGSSSSPVFTTSRSSSVASSTTRSRFTTRRAVNIEKEN